METRVRVPKRRAPRAALAWVAVCAAVSMILSAGLGLALHGAAVALAAGSKSDASSPAVEWSRPRTDDRQDERSEMVLVQIRARGVNDPAVIEAMEHVPRHRFVPERYSRDAYADSPLPIGYGQTISQPFIVAYMTELLGLTPGDRVLEIGTGSGYQAAVLSELTPHVFTIEILEALGALAADRLAELGYGTIETAVADGYFGWEEHAPFDAVLVTCAAGHVPPPLVEQLKPGGRMVIPVGPVYDVQYLIRVIKDEEGEVRSERLLPVRFVPMTGQAQEGQ